MSLLSRLLFPPKCTSCSTLLGIDVPEEQALCDDCQRLWESEALETCGVCAKRVGDCACLTERMQKARCQGFYKLVYYVPSRKAPVQNRLIYAVKQTRDRRSVAFLASELWSTMERLLREEKLERNRVILTYLPRSAMARLQYGTDQAKMLAKELGRLSGLPVESLIRRKGGRANSQKKLDPIARYQNAKSAFEISEGSEIKGRVIFLIDDIVTTGASMAVGTRLLRKMGAREVYAFAVASDIFNRDRSVY